MTPGTRLGAYTIRSKLGAGGMGEVWLAEDSRLDRRVAIKLLPPDQAESPERRRRFEREAKAVAALKHPNIVTIYSVEQAGGKHFLTMELVEGPTLDREIGGAGLPLDRLFDIAVPLTDAVAAAHRRGIVHRDLKPANVMLDEDGRVKVLDFGLAKLRESESAGEASQLPTEELTHAGHVIGTVPYMAPEQVQGKPADARSDVFALGVMLYEMATGSRPFGGETSADLISSILRDAPAPITERRDDLPRHLGRIVRRCLEKAPERRYGSAAELRDELRDLRRELETGETPLAPSDSALSRGQVPAAVPRRRHPISGPIVATLVAGMVVAVTWVGFRIYRDSMRALVETPPPPRETVVVLPFENLGAAEDAYFAAGVTEEIASRLAAVRALGVISRTTALNFDRTGKTLRQIGEELGADYVLEGSVRWDRAATPSRVRVTPQLARTSDDTQVWTDRYDRELQDIFSVQTEIAQRVIDELNVRLAEHEEVAVEFRPTENIEAFQLYLRGIEAERDVYSLESQRRAIDLYRRAVELDPKFALAWARLSRVHSYLNIGGLDRTPENLAQAKQAVEAALRIREDLPQSHLAMGYYFYHGLRDYDRALEAFAVAREGMPNDAQIPAAIGYIRRRQGRWEESATLLQQAIALDPRDEQLHRELAVILSNQRRYDEAIEECERSIALAPDNDVTYGFRAVILQLSGDLPAARRAIDNLRSRDEAVARLARWRQLLFERDYAGALEFAETAPPLLEASDLLRTREQLRGQALALLGRADEARAAYDSARLVLQGWIDRLPDDPRAHGSQGLVLAALGDRDGALREGRRGVELLPVEKDALHGPTRVNDLARIHAAFGEAEAAVALLDGLLAAPGVTTVPLLRLDPDWDRIRDHPAFVSLLEKYSAARRSTAAGRDQLPGGNGTT